MIPFKDYLDHIAELEKIRSEGLPIDFSDPESIDLLMKELDLITAPLKDGRLDPGDYEAIFDLWWEKFKMLEIELAKKETEIQFNLIPLYELLLKRASQSDWEEYAKMKLHARFESPIMKYFLDIFAKSYEKDEGQ